ncbi:MAG TPA: glycosyltransferase family 1 protein [Solirubrobacteraceae bacterium]
MTSAAQRRIRHIGVNAVFLQPRMGGLDTLTRALVPELAALRPDVRISVFCNRQGREYLAREGWADAVELVTHPLLGRRGLRAASELTLLGRLADARGVDVLHSVALTAPLSLRAANVVTIADVTWIVAAEPDERWTVRLWRLIVPPVARRADRVIAISKAGAEHVVEYLHVPRDRIDVIYPGHGVDEPAAGTAERDLRERLELGSGPIVLTVAAKKAHKNLLRLVRAMAEVRAAQPNAVLVLPGNPTPHERELRAEVDRLGLSDGVRFPAYVDAADLEGLYGAASCFVFASINEGFGLPILEAMRRGVPVACSNVSAMPEAAGDAARYFDPFEESQIAAAIGELLSDHALAARLVEAGRRQQAKFTWRACAEATLDSYERAIAGRR